MNDDILNDSLLEDSVINTDPDAERNQPQTAPAYNPYGLNLDEEESKAREEASWQNASGVVRVSDSPSSDPTSSSELPSTHSLYGTTLGVSRHQELREKVGLRDGDSFTDYYKRTLGKVPMGFELEAKLLLKEEERQRYYHQYEQGQLGWSDFLYKAYGRDLMKQDGIDMRSSLYWYNKFRQGDYSNPLENASYMQRILQDAEMLFEAEEWWRASHSRKMSDIAASYVTGERLTDETVRELFEEQFEHLDDYYESTEKIIKYYRAGYLQGFNPTIDINGDGKVDYYFHTDGKLYAIEGSEGVGTHKARAMYNDDGSLNRIVLTGSGFGEISGAAIKGFTSLFTGLIDLGGMIGGSFVDLVDGIAGRGWNFENTVSNSVAVNAWLNQDTFAFGNNEYVMDSGLRTSDGNLNAMRIAKGVSAAAGTITAMLATAGLGKVAKTSSLAATAGLQTAMASGKAAATKAIPKYAIKKTTAGLVKTATSLTGLQNGAPFSARYATTQSVSLLAVKDFMQAATSMTINKEQLGMTDSEIASQAFRMAALNAGVSFALRSVMDQAATTRWATYAEKLQSKSEAANTLVADGKFNSALANKIMQWHKAAPRTMVRINTAMDVFENMFTAYTQSSVAQTGEMFNAEAFKTFISNPQILAFNIWAGVASAKGGLGRLNEGTETGGILRHTGDIIRVDGEIRAELKSRIAKSTDAKQTKTWIDVYNRYDAQTKAGDDTFLNITTAMINLHNGLQREDMSFVRNAISRSIHNSIRVEKLAELQLAYSHYNAMVKATNKVARDGFRGKISNALHYRRAHVVERFDALLTSHRINVSKAGVKDFTQNMGGKDIQDLTSKLIEENARLIENDKIERAMDLFKIKGLQDEIITKPDGTFDLKTEIDGLKPAELQVLRDAELDIEALREGYFIRLDGKGTDTQGTQDYADMQQMLRTFVTIANSEMENAGTVRLMIPINEDSTIVFIPNHFMNGNNVVLASTGRAIQTLYTLRYANSADDRVAAMKLFTSLFANDNQLDLKDLPTTETVAMLDRLVETQFITLRDASIILKDLDAAHALEMVGNKEKIQSPSELLRGSEIRKYHDALDKLDQIQTILSKSKDARTETDLIRLRRLHSEFTNETDPKIKEQLIKDGILSEPVMKAIDEWVKLDPKTSQDLLKLLEKQVSSSSNRTVTDVVIRYISDLLGTEPPVTTPTPKQRAEQLRDLTTSRPVQRLVSSETFTIKDGEVRNVLTASRSDLIQFFMDQDPKINKGLAARRANIAMKLLADYQDAEVTRVTKDFGENAEAFYRRVYREIGDDSNLDIDVIKSELYNSRHGINLLERLERDYANKPLQQRLEDAMRFADRMLEGTTNLEGDGRVIIDVGSLEGKRTRELHRRLSTAYFSQKMDEQVTEEGRLKVIFGENYYAAVKELAMEYAAMEAIRIQYPSGRVAFSMSDPNDVGNLSRLLYKLNYDVVELRNNRKVEIPGIYYKPQGHAEAALSFAMPKAAFDKMIQDLRASYGYKSFDTGESGEHALDHTEALHRLFGGLTHIDDETVINPTKVIFNDINLNNLKEATFEILDYISSIEGLNHKQGKLAGLLIKTSLESQAGMGLAFPRDMSMRQYDIVINSIRALGDFTEGKHGMPAVTNFELTPREAQRFNDNSPVWKMVEGAAKSEETGKRIYRLESTLKGEAFITAAIDYFQKPDADLNYILPTFGISTDGKARNVAISTIDLNQQSISYGPLSLLRSVFGTKYTLDEILDTFRITNFEHKYNLDIAEDVILDTYFRNKPVSEIIATHDTLDATVQDNLYYRMMYNMVVASKELSAAMETNLINRPDGLMSVIGSHEARTFLGQRFNEVLETKERPTAEDFNRIAADLQKHMEMDAQFTDDSDANFYRQDTLSPASTYVTGSQSRVLFGRNTIPALSGRTIEYLFDIIGEHRTAFSTEQSVMKGLPDQKILQLLIAGGSERDGKVNLFVDSLYDLNLEQRQRLLDLLEGRISKKDMDLLKDKFILLDTESDLYRGDNVPETEGELLAVGRTLERTISLKLDTAALIYRGDKDGSANNLNKLLNYVEKSFRHNQGKKEYKLSEIESLKEKNLEFNAMKKLGQIIGVEVLPGINREASILLKNLEIKDNLATFVNANSRLADALMNIDFNGNKLNPQAATELAFKMYLYSSGTDFQSEWTKYLFVDTRTGEIIDTAQRMTGDRELNDYMRGILRQFDKLEDNPNIVAFELDKNMMMETLTAGGGRLKYVEINPGNKQMLIDAVAKNALDQWQRNSYYRNENPDILTTLDKVAYVYAHTPTLRDRKEAIISHFVSLGVDEATARKTSYNYLDLQSSKQENSKHAQILFNTWELAENATGNQRALMHRQMKNVNDVIKYGIVYDSVPETVKRAMADKVGGQGGVIGRMVESILFGSEAESVLSVNQTLKDIQSKFNEIIQQSQELKDKIAALPTTEDLDTRAKAIIQESAELYERYADYYELARMFSFDKDLTRQYEFLMEEIKMIHRKNTAELHAIGQDHRQAFIYSKQHDRVMQHLAKLGTTDVNDPEFRKAFLKSALKNYIFNSKEAAAVSLALNNTDIDYLFNFRDTSMPVRIKLQNGTDIDLNEVLTKTTISYDGENFYNKSGDQAMFQFGLYIRRADGTEITREFYIPVYDERGHLIKDAATLYQRYPEFFAEYANQKALMDAVDGYVRYFSKENPLIYDIDGIIQQNLRGETDVYSLGFNSKGHDNKLLLDQKLVKPDSILVDPNRNIDVLNEVIPKVQSYVDIGNKRDLQTLLRQVGLTAEAAHTGGDDARNTYLLLKHYVDRAVPLNKLRSDGLDDMEAIGRRIMGENFKLEDYKDIFDESMRLEYDDLPAETRRWIDNYRAHFKNLDNLYGMQEVVNRINHLYLQQESEINRKKGQEYIRTLPEETVSLIYKLQDPEARGELLTLISYLAQRDLSPISNKLYKEFGETSSLEFKHADPEVEAKVAAKRNSQLDNLINEDRTGVLDKVIDIFHRTYADEFKTMRNLSSILSKDPAEILEDISNSVHYRGFVSKEGYARFKESSAAATNRLQNVINNEFLESTRYTSIRDNENYKSIANRLYRSIDPINEGIINNIKDPQLKAYLSKELTTLYGKSSDRDLTGMHKVYEMDSALRDNLLDYVKTHYMKRITQQQIHKMIQGLKVGDRVAINGKQEEMDSNTLYINQRDFRKVFGADFDVAKDYYAADQDNLYVPVIRHPNDKPQLVFMKVKVSDDANLQAAMSHDSLKALLSGDVDGDGISFIRPTKSLQAFGKDILPITRVSFDAWDKVSRAIDGFEVRGVSLEEDVGIIKHFQSFLLRDTEQDIKALNEGKADYDKLKAERIKQLTAEVKAKGYALDADDIEELISFVWINRGPNLSYFESKGTRRPYFSPALEAYKTQENIDAMQRIKDSRNNLRPDLAAGDTITGSRHKRQLMNAEYETTFNRISNYAPFGLSEMSIARLMSLFKTQKDTVLPVIKATLKNYVTDKKNATSYLYKRHQDITLKRIDAIEDVVDFVSVLRYLEADVRDSVRAERTIAKTIQKYSKDLKTEFDTNPEDQYMKALYALESTQKGIEGEDFVSRQLKAHEALNDIVKGMTNTPYFRNSEDNQDTINFLIDQYRRHLPQKHEVKTNLDSFKEPGFSNFQRRTVLYVKDDPQLKVEDSMFKGPAAQDMQYVFAKKLSIPYDEVLNVQVGESLRAGMKLTQNMTVPESYDGYEVLRVLNDNQIILGKRLEIDGEAKLGIAGTAMTKGTLRPISFDAKGYDQDFLKDVSIISDISGYSDMKVDSSVAGEFTFRYFDANFKETTADGNYQYIKMEAPVAVAAHTGTWTGRVKPSVVDEVTLGTSARTLEGMGILGDNVIKYDAGLGKVVADSRDIAALEQILRQMNQPDYMSNNAAPTYKMLLYVKLAEFNGLDRNVQDVISSTKFAGVYGTQEIRKLLRTTDIDAFMDSLNPMEKALFSDDIMRQVFKYSPHKIPGVDELPTQTSKSSHYQILKRLKSTTFAPPIRQKGPLVDLDNSDFDGGIVRDTTDSYISGRDLLNGIITAYNKTAKEPLRTISKTDAQNATSLGILNESDALFGGQSRGFNPIPKKYALELDHNPNKNIDTNFKVGSTETLIRSRQDAVDNFNNVHPGRDYNESINTRVTKDNYLSSKARTTTEYADGTRGPEQVYRDRLAILLSGVMANTKDAVERAGLIHPRYSHMSFHPNRLRLGLDEGTNRYTVKAQPIPGYGNIPATKFNAALRESFSTRDFFTEGEKSQRLISEQLEGLRGLDNIESIRPDVSDDVPEGRLKGAVSPTRFLDQELSAVVNEAVNSTFVRPRSVKGQDETMHKTYGKDALSSSGMKLDSEEAVRANQHAIRLKTEAAAIARDFYAIYRKVYMQASTYGVADETNEYAFLKGSLNRVRELEKLKTRQTPKDELKHLNDLQKQIISKLGMSEAEAKSKVTKFESIYGDVVESMNELNMTLGRTAAHYSKVTGEITGDAFWLLTPNIMDGTGKERRNYVTSMFLETRADVGFREQDYSKIPSFDGYHYFAGMDAMIKKISKQTAIYNAGIRWKEDGYLDNYRIEEVVAKYFNEYREIFADIGKDSKQYMSQEERDNFAAFAAGIESSFERLNISLTEVRNNVSSRRMSVGEGYLFIYDMLDEHIANHRMTRHEAYDAYLTAKSQLSRAQAEELVKLYDYSNDIIAILSMSQAKQASYKKSDATFMNGLYQKLKEAAGADFVLVDRFGRALDPDVNNYRMIAEGSTEYIKEVIKYYSGFSKGFEVNVAMDAMNGDIFFMPKSLSDTLMNEFYVHKIPSNTRQFLKKAQALTVKLIMSNPYKAIDRVSKFSAFDLALLTMANPHTVTKIGKSRADLSAFLASKGSVQSEELREYLYARGLDPNRMNLNQILNGANDFDKIGNVGSTGYFGAMNKLFSYQTEFVRYAYWLSTKEKLAKGGGTVYGSAYSQKDHIKGLGEIRDVNGNVRVSKEGNQAVYLMGQNLGAPGDFPILAKKLNGYAAFTTFPLALVRWGRGEATSMYSAIKNLGLEGERTGAIKHLSVQGLGLAGIFLTSRLIYMILGDMFNIPEEEREEWEKMQAVPRPFATLMQGSPVMDTFSSINPVNELYRMGPQSFAEESSHGDNLGSKVWSFALRNVIGRASPPIRGAAEVLTGYDLLDDKLINTRDQYNIFENLFRKTAGYVMGMTGSNALMRYMNSYEDHEKGTIERIGIGLTRAAQAELGNTRVYKSNIRNYYKANGIIQGYRFSDMEEQDFSGSNFNYDEYTELRRTISRLMQNKAKYSDIYAAIESAMESGVGLSEIRSAVRNNSLRYKLSRIENIDAFFNSLTHTEKESVRTAIAYEDYIFPWLDELEEELDTAVRNQYGRSQFQPRRYYNNYTPYLQRHYSPYSRPRSTYNQDQWREPLIKQTPLQAFKGEEEWRSR